MSEQNPWPQNKKRRLGVSCTNARKAFLEIHPAVPEISHPPSSDFSLIGYVAGLLCDTP